MQNQFTKFFILTVFILLPLVNILPQDEVYYSSLSTSSSTFVSDLQSRIRIPYTKRSYTEYRDLMIPNYESYPVNSTQRGIKCVYSGYELIYTPPFAFGTIFSREHTYCQSWWDVSSTSNPYYSDFHHLFPTQQPNANSLRSNHPLGTVVTPTTVFLECKLGTNAAGQVMYEPRDAHKGDAARAMIYMEVRYDHDGTYGNWNFKWLNEVKLPSLPQPEAPQDLNTLLTWAKQDPPDRWEVERNNYIATLQQNRNPFVDHPEYLNYIKIYDLTKLNPVYSTEPANQVTNFTSTASSSNNSITINWTNPTTGQLPSGYLVLAYDTNNYFIPIDGEVYADNTTFTNHRAIVNIPYSNVQSYTFNNLALNTNYYFTIFPYNGNDTLRNYKLYPLTRTNDTTGSVVPVELTSFTASQDKGSINLQWQTATELNNNGFYIEKGSEKNANGEIIFNRIGFVKGNGSSTVNHSYSFTDKLTGMGKYYYRLKQIDNNGTFKYSPTVEINYKQLLKGYYLDQNYPNPFNPTTNINFTLANNEFVTLKIYDLLGREVKTLINGVTTAGDHSVQLNGNDMVSGVYIYKISAGSFNATRKLTLIK
ncbi:MAG: endonuclease [Bacteroidota bacterium]|nr:endonuclease [Bacteroidota bacterium]